jgi:hypothetical protein
MQGYFPCRDKHPCTHIMSNSQACMWAGEQQIMQERAAPTLYGSLYLFFPSMHAPKFWRPIPCSTKAHVGISFPKLYMHELFPKQVVRRSTELLLFPYNWQSKKDHATTDHAKAATWHLRTRFYFHNKSSLKCAQDTFFTPRPSKHRFFPKELRVARFPCKRQIHTWTGQQQILSMHKRASKFLPYTSISIQLGYSLVFPNLAAWTWKDWETRLSPRKRQQLIFTWTDFLQSLHVPNIFFR